MSSERERRKKRKTILVYKESKRDNIYTQSIDNLMTDDEEVEEIVDVSSARGQTSYDFPQDRLVEPLNIMYSEREADAIHHIMMFLVNNEPQILREYFNFIKKQDYDTLAACFLSLSFDKDVTFPMIKYFLEDEFSSRDPKKVLRENCPISKIIKSYLVQFGNPYLRETLYKDVIQICVNEKKTSLEVNTNVVTEQEACTNLDLLKLKVDNILTSITKSGENLPVGVRVIAKYIRECAEDTLPDQVNTMVGAFLFLRYLNPAICFPEGAVEIIPKNKPVSSNVRRNLVLITKIMQNVSNGQDFSKKEFFMTPLNGFVKSRQEEVATYFQDVTNFQVNLYSIHDDEVNEVSVHHIHIFHSLLFKYKSLVLPLFKKQETADEFEKLLEELGSYESKVSFSYLGDQHQRYVQSAMSSRNEEVSYVGIVDYAIKKGKKPAESLIIVGMNRVIILRTKDGKALKDFHQLSIQSITCSTGKLAIVLDSEDLNFNVKSDQMANIVNSIKRLYDFKFPGIPDHLMFTINAPDNLLAEFVQPESVGSSAYVRTYVSLCNYYGLQVNETFAFDIQHLYKNNTCINIGDYANNSDNPISGSDFLPVFHMLAYCKYFTDIVIENIKLDKTGLGALVLLMETNCTMTSLSLKNIVINAGRNPFSLIFEAMDRNDGFKVTHLSLSGTSIVDKCFSDLGIVISQLNYSMEEIDVTNTVGDKCGVGFSNFLDSLSRNSSNLSVLKLGGNKLSEAGSSLCNFLKSAPMLRSLDLGSTRLERNDLNMIMEEGFVSSEFINMNLTSLDLSNTILKVKNNVSLGKLKLWWGGDTALTHINLSGTQIPSEEWVTLLSSISTTNNLSLDISKNNIGVRGGQAIAGVIASLNLNTLNIADTSLGDEGLVPIIQSVYNNESITHLNVSNNFSIKNSKNRSDLIFSLGQMLSSNILPLQTLIMRGDSTKNRLREGICKFLETMDKNTTLEVLDITGHGMMNKGAVTLAKMLIVNTTITTIYLDDNQIGSQGLWNIKEALELNPTRRFISLPVQDIVAAMRDSNSPETKLSILESSMVIQNPKPRFQ